MKLHLLLFAICCVSCMHEKLTQPETAAATPANVSPALDGSALKLVKKASYRFQVDNVTRSFRFIENLVTKYPAYLSNSRLSTSPGLLEHRVLVRVQALYFDDFLKEVDSQPLFTDHRNVTTADHSKEFVDLEARLKTKKAVQDRYIAILRNKTGSIEEVLSAERQIGEIQEEIEAAVSRLNYLKDEVAYSTVELEMYQYLKLEATTQDVPIGSQFASAFRAGTTGMTRFMIAVTPLWPLFVIALAGWIVTVRIRRRRKPVT